METADLSIYGYFLQLYFGGYFLSLFLVLKMDLLTRNLEGNQFSRTVPSELGKLIYMETLYDLSLLSSPKANLKNN